MVITQSNTLNCRQKETEAEPLPNLAYTVAFDAAGYGGTRQMARMLAGSLARTIFDGEIRVFRNSPEPFFLVQRTGVEEVFVETPDLQGQRLADYAMDWKARAAEWIDGGRFGWVMYVDADCLALRNLDHLLDREDADILYQPEPGRPMTDPVFRGYLTAEEMGRQSSRMASENSESRQVPSSGAGGGPEEGDHTAPSPPTSQEANRAPLKDGVNAGTWAVRGGHYAAVMAHWRAIMEQRPLHSTMWREQSAWNRLILDARAGLLRGDDGQPLRARPFEAREIMFPLHLDRDWKHYKDAALVHFLGGTPAEKIEFMFGLYMQKFFHDPATTLLSILEM